MKTIYEQIRDIDADYKDNYICMYEIAFLMQNRKEVLKYGDIGLAELVGYDRQDLERVGTSLKVKEGKRKEYAKQFRKRRLSPNYWGC